MAVLEMTSPEGRETIELLGDRISIGRSGDNDIVIKGDSSMSRSHALFERIGKTWYVKDLNSLNGVDINGRPVLSQAALHHMDEVILGRTKLVFLDRSVNPDSSTQKKAPPPKLTAREKETLVELCRPLFASSGNAFTAPAAVAEIASRMFIGEAGVKQHLGRLYDKFGIFSDDGINRRHELANQAIQRGCITQHDYKRHDSDDV
jgi:FHA domain